MSNDRAEKRQGFERWVSSLRLPPGTSPVAAGEESGVTSLDEQKTLVQHLPKDVVRQLREREANRHLAVDPDSTAIFQPPPELLARARRLVPPKKPERSVAPSAPPESVAPPLLTPVVAAPFPEEEPVTEERALPLPALADAVESEAPPPEEAPVERLFAPREEELMPEPRRASRLAWTAVALGAAVMAACAWFALAKYGF